MISYNETSFRSELFSVAQDNQLGREGIANGSELLC